MAIDASICTISKVEAHPNADRLEVATVSNYTCVIGKGEFKAGDKVLFIRPDAALVKPEVYTWQAPLVKYLGGRGRVKTVKLRKVFSNGIIVGLDKLNGFVDPALLEHVFMFIDLAKNDTTGEYEKCGKGYDFAVAQYAKLLETSLGIIHYNPPAPSDNSALHACLPFGLPKSDELNWQDLPDEELALGEEVLVTRKLDGSSCTIIAEPNGTIHICSRSMELKPECGNKYTHAAEIWLDPLKDYAKRNNIIIVARGEVTGEGINKNGANRDCHGEATFNLYGTWFIDPVSQTIKSRGYFGTSHHFTVTIDDIYAHSLPDCPMMRKRELLKTVPILGTAICTKELLQKYVDAPASEGEGIVVNHLHGSFKSKSQDYYSKI